MPISLWSNSARGIREGQQGFIEVRVTDSLGRPAPAGTLLSYSISGSGITQSDFYGTPLSGQVVVGNNGIARLAIYTEIDRVVDSESFNVSFTNRTYSSSGFSVGGSIIDVQPVTPPVTPPPVTPPVTPPANTATEGADTYTGTSGANTFNGLAGNDIIDGAGGNDTLSGGIGNDTISGGTGNDVLKGDAGNDTIDGGAGDDVIDGGAGTDTATYASATSGVTVNLGVMNNGVSQPQNTGGAGVDTLIGIERLIGSAFDDSLTAFIGSPATTLEGGNGNDRLEGGNGADTLIGGQGSDTLWGRSGKDTMSGGSQSDTFVFNAIAETTTGTTTTDVITDFQVGVDKIALSGIDASTVFTGDNAFVWKGTGGISSTDGAGEVSYQIFDNAGTADDYTMVYLDTDSTSTIEGAIRLTGLVQLTANDFIL